MLCGVNLPFGRLSLCVRQVTYALRTRAPVSCIAAIPLNLHVLGLSLAFILSQDQTLHCKKNYLSLYKSFFLNSSNLLFFPFLHLSNIVNDRISLFRRPNSFAWSGCKGKKSLFPSKGFVKNFTKIFSKGLDSMGHESIFFQSHATNERSEISIINFQLTKSTHTLLNIKELRSQ